MGDFDIGLFGLAVMGQNLALNIASKGFKIAVCNRSPEKVDATVARASAEGLSAQLAGFKALPDFVQSLKSPRKIILLVKAGSAVDDILEQIVPLLSPDDIVIDGGNEWYELTERRSAKYAAEAKIRYLGMGVSGGEEGARNGPALMPGGDAGAFRAVEPVLLKIAAAAEGKPCVTYCGTGGSGNFVKMVHNGIEYGDMQLIAEAYELLRRLAVPDLAKLFAAWNEGELKSYLIEITAKIMRTNDADGKPLVDKILDVAGSKGTGMWTVREAALRGIPCPTIAAALDMRMLSGLRETRKAAASTFAGGVGGKALAGLTADEIKDALYCSKICSYAQGLMLLKSASEQQKWNIDLQAVAEGWRDGCIIRAVFLNRIASAFQKNRNLPSLLLDPGFAAEIKSRMASWRKVVSTAQGAGVAVPALSASLAYFDALTAERLPLNLVQAQRDFFGAHTFQRVDDPAGKPIHHEWTE